MEKVRLRGEVERNANVHFPKDRLTPAIELTVAREIVQNSPVLTAIETKTDVAEEPDAERVVIWLEKDRCLKKVIG